MSAWKKLIAAAGDDEVARSQSIYTIPGQYSWTCPDGVTSVSVVCVGGGGGGPRCNGGGGIAYKVGGGGGALAYKNNISVTPGSSYTVKVGTGGFCGYNYNTNGTSDKIGEDGGSSYFINSSTVNANGGLAGPVGDTYSGYPKAAATYTGDGGGNGGQAGVAYGGNYAGKQGGGGGGAGGYSGNGGTTGSFNGYNTAQGVLAVNPTGGAGAHGAAYYGTQGGAGGGGGGTGIFGAGSTGAVQSPGTAYGPTYAGGGGSGGEDGYRVLAAIDFAHTYSGIAASGGWPGGGGGCGRSHSGLDARGGEGAGGAVRIVWPGDERLFPSTDVDNN